ncbi:MAG: hypothetical protein AAGA45_03595, partial [Verrucomicrobiota bacterium]
MNIAYGDQSSFWFPHLHRFKLVAWGTMQRMQVSENTKLMEWQFNPPARHSSVSGTAFSEGELVTCVLFINNDGLLERADLQEAELAAFSAPGGLLGRWRREVKTPDEEAKEARAQLMATTEELFL